MNFTAPSRLLLASAWACAGVFTTLTLGACQGPEERGLVSPTARAKRVGMRLKRRLPHARIIYSQVSGEILWVDGGGKALQAPATPGAPTPTETFKTLRRFFDLDLSAPAPAPAPPQTGTYYDVDGFSELYALHDTTAALGNPLLKALPSGGGAILRFEQFRDGFPYLGHHGLAFFDSQGGLLALMTRIEPEPGAADKFQAPPLHPQSGTSSQALTPIPTQTRLRWIRANPGRPLQLLETEIQRVGPTTREILRNPQTGETWIKETTPSQISDSPSLNHWAHLPAEPLLAPDLQGDIHTVLSTRALDGRIVLGFMSASIGDLANSWKTSSTGTLSTDRDSWIDEPEYAGTRLTDATLLARHIQTTLSWFEEHLNYRPWDGKGNSTSQRLKAFIRAVHPNDSESGETLNAYGGNGYIMIGNGLSKTGRPLSESLDLVAHEFTHSVISATADFRYEDESGALNESLADVFGLAVGGYTDTLFGNDAGWTRRDLLFPSAYGDPERYSEYVVTDEDNGGVHTNSGIMNRALTLAILSTPDGAVAIPRILLRALQEIPWSRDTRLEEFAATLHGYCELDPVTTADLCERLESAFIETELLNR